MNLKCNSLVFVIIYILVQFIFIGCSGYSVSYAKNPFSRFGIKSVSIPMFVNHTVVPDISSKFTKEMVLLLSNYRDLKILNGENVNADGILIGILSSADDLKGTFVTTEEKTLSGSDIGSRREFKVPSKISYSIKLTVFLIKDPLYKHKEIFNEKIVSIISKHPDVVLTGEASFSQTYDVELNAESFNFVRTKGTFDKTLDTMAQNAAIHMDQVVFNAF